MADKPTYEELEQRVKELESSVFDPKRSEEALQRSTERFRRLFEQASDAFFIHDFNNGKIVDVNESACKNLGYTRDELLELNVSDIEISQTPEAIVHICVRAEKDRTVIVEGIHRRKDGSTFPVEISLGMLQDENPALLLAIARDTTEREKANDALQESEAKHRGLIEGLDEAIYRMSFPDGKYAYMSPAARKVFGYSAEEFMENPLFMRKVIHPDFAEYFKEKWADLIEQKVSPTYKYKILDPEGNERWIVQSNTGIFDDGGNLIAIEGLCRNITKGAQAEKELRESEELHKKAQSVAHIGHWELNPEIGTPLWSDEIFRIFGLKPQEREPSFTDHETHLHPDDWPLLNKSVTLANTEGTPFDIIFRIVRPDSEIRWMHAIGTTTKDEKGKVTKLFGTAQDITDRKRAEEALRESEALLRTAGRTARFGGWSAHLDEHQVVWSEQVALIHEMEPGYSPTIKEAIQFYAPAWREKIATAFEACAQEGTPYDEEMEIVTANDRHLWVRTTGESVRNNSGKIVRIQGSFQDINEHKRAEQALKNNQIFLKRIINQSPFATWISDEKGTMIKCNAALKKFLNITDEQLIGKYNVFEDEVAIEQGEIPKIRTVFEDGKTVNLSAEWDGKELGYKDAKKVHIESTMFPIHDDKGDLTNVVNHWIDITERKQAEKTLVESEKKHREMIANISDVIGILDIDGTIKYKSPSIKKWFGWRPEDLVGTDGWETVHPDDLDRVQTEFFTLLKKENSTTTVEYRYKCKDGSYKMIELTAVNLLKDSIVSGILMNYHDITERKRAEEEKKKLQTQLHQAQKIEAIGTLAGGIAHDFNNLLMAIQGRASIMMMNKDSSHPDIKHLNGIEDNIESAADLTRQLLGFARGGRYEVRPTDLNELIKKQNRMFGRTKKEISIRGKYQENLWSVEVDRGQIEQVLLNLYVNAWQAMHGGGDLYLETENLTLDETDVKPFTIEPGKYVKISVTDTGVGMDKATREKIFEPFFTTKEMGKGTGLGLASAYGIIKNHDGFINVYSEKGHGTTFNIYLPASEKEVVEEKKSAGDTLKGSETVLFVDDEDMIIEVAGELFQQLGYKVLTAKNGKDAIEIYEENKEHIDIVLLDMIMPNMSGSDTYDKIKKIDPDIKVLLSSGYSINGQATEIMDRGCNGFIQKPFKMKELSQKLREILDKK